MSIASEISRIMTAKSDIASALATKGINVGSGKLQTYAPAIISATGIGTEPDPAPTGVVVPAGINCTQPLYQKYSDIAWYTSGLISVLSDNGVTIPSGTKIDGLPALINAWTPGPGPTPPAPAPATLNVTESSPAITINSTTHIAAFANRNDQTACLIPFPPTYTLDYPNITDWEFRTRIYWDGSEGANGAAAILGHTDTGSAGWNNAPYLFISTSTDSSSVANYGKLCAYLKGQNGVIAGDVASSDPKLVSAPLTANVWYKVYMGCRELNDGSNQYQYYLKIVNESNPTPSEVTLNSADKVRNLQSGDTFLLLNNTMYGYKNPNYGTQMDLTATVFKTNVDLWTAYGTICTDTTYADSTPSGSYPDRIKSYRDSAIASSVATALTAATDWEIYMRSPSHNYAAWELASDNGSGTALCRIGIFSNSFTEYLRVYLKDSQGNVLGDGPGEQQFPINYPSSYWEYRIRLSNSVVTVSIRYDGVGSFSTLGTLAVPSGNTVDFGSAAMKIAADYDDDFYMDRCYIKVGSSYLWCPSGMLYVPSDLQV